MSKTFDGVLEFIDSNRGVVYVHLVNSADVEKFGMETVIRVQGVQQPKGDSLPFIDVNLDRSREPEVALPDWSEIFGAVEVPTVSVQIGGIRFDYAILTTNADREYDSFGSFTIDTFREWRVVCVKVQHVAWHVNRYASGMKTARPCDISGIKEHATEELFRRIINGTSDK